MGAAKPLPLGDAERDHHPRGKLFAFGISSATGVLSPPTHCFGLKTFPFGAAFPVMGLAGRRVSRIPLPGTGSWERGGCPSTAASQEQSTDSKIKKGLQNPRDLHQSHTIPFISLGSRFPQPGSITASLFPCPG